VFSDNIEAAVKLLTQLRNLGVQLSIDDFGTGYSSLSYLQRFPIDTLKIDRSFVTQMMENEENLAIVRTIVALAQNLGMDVVAEGVETEDQLRLLRKLECENGQGFLFSAPNSISSFPTVISTRNRQMKWRSSLRELFLIANSLET
jgi:EAL domain-containing protein (putative c-di-GMP-specific phosphodiesterase class I)